MSSYCTLRLLLVVNISAAIASPIRQESLEVVIWKMQQASDRQRANLCSYSVDRRYTVQNKRLSSNAVMSVRMVYKLGQRKHFETPSMQGIGGLTRHSLLNLLKEEVQASQEQNKNSWFDSANYDFVLLGLEQLRTRTCYRVRLKPRRKSKYLIDGEAWIDVKEYAVVQIKGQLSQKPSFWVHRAEVEQQFKKVQDFWLPSCNRSLANITFVGETRLTIEYLNYQVKGCQRQ